jgi:hypothetical protein
LHRNGPPEQPAIWPWVFLAIRHGTVKNPHHAVAVLTKYYSAVPWYYKIEMEISFNSIGIPVRYTTVNICQQPQYLANFISNDWGQVCCVRLRKTRGRARLIGPAIG